MESTGTKVLKENINTLVKQQTQNTFYISCLATSQGGKKMLSRLEQKTFEPKETKNLWCKDFETIGKGIAQELEKLQKKNWLISSVYLEVGQPLVINAQRPTNRRTKEQ